MKKVVSISILIAMLSLSACANDASSSSSVPEPTPSNSLLTADLPEDVTAKGVLLAAVILKSGNVEEAVANGLISPSEVDAAIDAIAENTLGLWEERAEADLG